MDIKRGMSSHGLSVYSRVNSVKLMTFALVDFVSLCNFNHFMPVLTVKISWVFRLNSWKQSEPPKLAK